MTREKNPSSPSFTVHLSKCLISIGTCLLSLALAIALFQIGRPFSAGVFLLLLVPFAPIAAISGGRVAVDQDGVSLQILGVCVRRFRWEEIREVGVMGTKVFNRHAPERTGSVFLYFSREELDESQRFDMMLKWPPLDKIYFLFSLERFDQVQAYWGRPVAKTNIGNIPL